MMKARLHFLLVTSGLLGVGITLAGVRLLAPSPPESSAFLRDLAIQELAGHTGTRWEVLQDKMDPSSPLQPGRLSRRIVAKVQTGPQDVQLLARELDAAIERSLAAHGATQSGEESFSESSISLKDQQMISSELSLPRYYYRAGKIRGMTDAWVIGNGSEATVIISISE